MKIKNKILNLMFAITLAFTTFSCSDDDKTEIDKLPTITEIVQADPTNYSVLIESLKRTLLLTTTSGPGSYTLFAPTNAAFAAYTSSAFPAGITLTATSPALTTAQEGELRNLLRNHILAVATKSDDLLTSRYVKTFASGPSSGTTLSMFVSLVGAGTDVVINGGASNGGTKVTKANIDASNGMVHFVENVIKLPTVLDHVEANPDLSTLTSIVTSTGGTFGDQSTIATALGGTTTLTLFAPLNSAFAAATTGSGFLTGAAVTAPNVRKVLQYHVSLTNLPASSSTSWTSSATVASATINTRATVGSTTAPQAFLITQGTLKITELPALPTVPASNIKTVNIQAANGIIHIVDRVLQPVF